MRIISNQKIGASFQGAGHNHIVIRVERYALDNRLRRHLYPFGHYVESGYERLYVVPFDSVSRQLLDKLVDDSITHQQSEFAGQPAVDQFLGRAAGAAAEVRRYEDVGIEDRAQPLSHLPSLPR